jgi:hypothetical protein
MAGGPEYWSAWTGFGFDSGHDPESGNRFSDQIMPEEK